MEELLEKLKRDPPEFAPEDTLALAGELISGNASSEQIVSALLGWEALQESPQHIAAVAGALRAAATPCLLEKRDRPDVICDIVGTGGDGQDTFNVSTAASIVAAGAGLCVAKHGNRASSSKCGSADVLEQLGCKLDSVSPDALTEIFCHKEFENSRYAFLFAQVYHPAMKHVAKERKSLGKKSIFNHVGPLTNPSRPTRMVVGVYSEHLGECMAKALLESGVESGIVVCGDQGLDEISPIGVTHVWKFNRKSDILRTTVSPEKDFGLKEHTLESVVGGDPEYNAAILKRLLDGKLPEQDPVLDFVLANAAALIYVSGKAESFQQGVQLARKSIDSGSARGVFQRFRDYTRRGEN